MSDDFSDNSFGGWSFLNTTQRVLILLAAMAALLWFAWPTPKPFVNPKIEAESYVWPAGCEQKNYEFNEQIAKACLAPEYFIGDGNQWGWQSTSRKTPYYRIKNDAVLISCSNKCWALETIKDVFVPVNSRSSKNGM